MLTDLKTILAMADEKNVAVPAFNVYNVEGAIGVLMAARETHAPVIFQMYTRLVDNYHADFVAPAILNAIEQLDTPAVFHLDHGAGIGQVIRALRKGVTGVMIDASTKPLEENIAITRQAVEICREVKVPVEGELGHVGGAADAVASPYTEVDEAVRFVNETGVDALAVMIGTAHGRYKQAPVLNIQRCRELSEATKTPLVLHGGSGVPDDQIRMAVEAGVRKANFATDLCYAFLDTLMNGKYNTVALDRVLIEPTNAIRDYAIEKIRLLGADKIL
ncbi:class II fructose-bisphosphate aldolase [bacterium]|nr:class II fructose-bisphosphate aldolase [bacterium]MDY4582540.1 class II fructose-bisphosphate aldolase [Candidatus Faecousia sp.]